MSNITKQLLIILFTTGTVGCGAQKQAAQGSATTKTAQSELQHQQAMEAIQQQRFIIRTEVFYLTGGPTKESTAGYITVSGNQGKFHFPSDISSVGSWPTKDIVDERVEITQIKHTKDAIKFQLGFDGNKQLFLVTLYKGSNECFVQVKSRYDSTTDKNRFRGTLLPSEQ